MLKQTVTVTKTCKTVTKFSKTFTTVIHKVQ